MRDLNDKRKGSRPRDEERIGTAGEDSEDREDDTKTKGIRSDKGANRIL